MSIPKASLFRSFWIGGFEGATHVNRHGVRLDMVGGTQHDRRMAADYKLLLGQGIRGCREALPWPSIDRGAGKLSFDAVAKILEGIRSTGMEVQWTLCHYGYPDDVDIFSPNFIDRLIRYAEALWEFFSQQSYVPTFFTPINEISFFTWAGCRDIMAPFARGRDADLKRQLCRATIECSKRLRALHPDIRLIQPDPLIHVVAPRGRPDLKLEAEAKAESQFEAWDIVAGRQLPELGGSERLLDIIGVNFYYANQWEADGDRLRWEDRPRDSRWKPLRHLLAGVWERYRRPLFISETSHFGVGRAAWLQEVADETLAAIRMGVPVEAICLYPIIDRFDWDDPSHWHHSGLWDLREHDGVLNRVLNSEYAATFARVREEFTKEGIS
jgi:beta-glucosidase/6-phospho-beta-glucosidase/beta-galactosidase